MCVSWFRRWKLLRWKQARWEEETGWFVKCVLVQAWSVGGYLAGCSVWCGMGGALCWCVDRTGPDRVLEVACGSGRCSQTRIQARSGGWGGAWKGGSGKLIKLDPKE